jgi:hypothetical protein
MASESYICNEEDKQTAPSDRISNHRDVPKSTRIRRDSIDFNQIKMLGKELLHIFILNFQLQCKDFRAGKILLIQYFQDL